MFVQLDDAKSQERIERKIKNAPEGQGTVRMLSREEWDGIQELRPRTPFESKISRPNARIRIDEPLKLVRKTLYHNLLAFCSIYFAENYRTIIKFHVSAFSNNNFWVRFLFKCMVGRLHDRVCVWVYCFLNLVEFLWDENCSSFAVNLVLLFCLMQQ